MREAYRNSPEGFTFFNKNPKSKVSGADCVARAISTATGKKWEDVIREITEHAISIGRVFNEKKAYDTWLEKNGWVKNKQPIKSNGRKYTVKEFLSLYPKGTYIISVANHLTMCEDGIVYDTWNCLHKSVGNFWSEA